MSSRKNVFLTFTPFHILLAISIAALRKNEVNHLLVVESFADFNRLLDAVKGWTQNPFSKILTFPGEFNLNQYSKIKRTWIRYFQVRKSTRDVLKYAFQSQATHFYIFNEERAQSLGLLNYVKDRKLYAEFVEDGANAYNSYLDQKSLHYLILGRMIYGSWWKNVPVMGTSEVFQAVQAVFPECIRPELKMKRIEKIDLSGIYEFAKQKTIFDYFSKYELTPDVLRGLGGIILLPFSSILAKEPGYRSILVKLIEHFSSKGLNIAVKYHPRDANVDFLNLKGFSNVCILNPAIPVEFIFLVPENNLKFVISDSSTTLMSALWSLPDCRIISLGELMGKKDSRFNDVLKTLGIKLPLNTTELESVLFSV